MFVLDFSRIAFSIFGFDIYWYGIIYAIAIAASWKFAHIVINQNSCIFHQKEFDKIMQKLIIFCVIFARIGHIMFFEPQYYLNNPIEILMIRHGGLSFHGGVIGVAIAIFTHKHQARYCKELMDILGFSGSIGIFIGRFANFFNQELYGLPTSSKFGVVFANVDFLPRHPTQIYEAIFEGLLNFAFMLFLYKKRCKIGSLLYITSFLCIYSISRFIIEYFKDVEKVICNITMGQILSIAYLLIIAVFWVMYCERCRLKCDI